ncbi:MAG: hypothetical protein ACYCY1_14485 [Sulfuriferula sp.]
MQREPVTITRHGRTAAFKAIFSKTDPQLTDAARALTDEDMVRMVNEKR